MLVVHLGIKDALSQDHPGVVPQHNGRDLWFRREDFMLGPSSDVELDIHLRRHLQAGPDQMLRRLVKGEEVETRALLLRALGHLVEFELQVVKPRLRHQPLIIVQRHVEKRKKRKKGFSDHPENESEGNEGNEGNERSC